MERNEARAASARSMAAKIGRGGGAERSGADGNARSQATTPAAVCALRQAAPRKPRHAGTSIVAEARRPAVAQSAAASIGSGVTAGVALDTHRLTNLPRVRSAREGEAVKRQRRETRPPHAPCSRVPAERVSARFHSRRTSRTKTVQITRRVSNTASVRAWRVLNRARSSERAAEEGSQITGDAARCPDRWASAHRRA